MSVANLSREMRLAGRVAVILSALLIGLPVSVIGAGKDPAQTVRQFYSWYVSELLNGSRPLESDREQVRRFATERLITEFGQRRKQDGRVDPFLNATEFDPGWAQNVAVGNYYVGRTMAKLGLILAGRKIGDRQIDVKMVMENGSWKIDDVKFLE